MESLEALLAGATTHTRATLGGRHGSGHLGCIGHPHVSGPRGLLDRSAPPCYHPQDMATAQCLLARCRGRSGAGTCGGGRVCRASRRPTRPTTSWSPGRSEFGDGFALDHPEHRRAALPGRQHLGPDVRGPWFGGSNEGSARRTSVLDIPEDLVGTRIGRSELTDDAWSPARRIPRTGSALPTPRALVRRGATTRRTTASIAAMRACISGPRCSWSVARAGLPCGAPPRGA